MPSFKDIFFGKEQHDAWEHAPTTFANQNLKTSFFSNYTYEVFQMSGIRLAFITL
jgi:hypothetical protein